MTTDAASSGESEELRELRTHFREIAALNAETELVRATDLRHFGYAKVRYRGLEKNRQHLMLLLGFTNLLRAEPQLA